jgi:thiamine-monophosphate kinase
MSSLVEKIELSKLLRSQPRSKTQLNGLFEADCEIIRSAGRYLCMSVDTIGEEIEIGLYKEPETWGWMCVMASMSDLSASGATPLGLLVSSQWSWGLSDETKRRCYKAIAQALRKTGTALLGGDSGGGSQTVMTSTVLGESKRKPLTRVGVHEGDLVVLFGKRRLGLGPAFGFEYLRGENGIPESQFRPQPSPRLIAKLRPWLHAAIDTSDGLATSLSILAELNSVGFELALPSSALHPAALAACGRMNLHPLNLLMGEHGDYQTLVTLPEKHLPRLRRATSDFVLLGRAVRRGPLRLRSGNREVVLPAERLTSRKKSLEDIKTLLAQMNAEFERSGIDLR